MEFSAETDQELYFASARCLKASSELDDVFAKAKKVLEDVRQEGRSVLDRISTGRSMVVDAADEDPGLDNLPTRWQALSSAWRETTQMTSSLTRQLAAPSPPTGSSDADTSRWVSDQRSAVSGSSAAVPTASSFTNLTSGGRSRGAVSPDKQPLRTSNTTAVGGAGQQQQQRPRATDASAWFAAAAAPELAVISAARRGPAHASAAADRPAQSRAAHQSSVSSISRFSTAVDGGSSRSAGDSSAIATAPHAVAQSPPSPSRAAAVAAGAARRQQPRTTGAPRLDRMSLYDHPAFSSTRYATAEQQATAIASSSNSGGMLGGAHCPPHQIQFAIVYSGVAGAIAALDTSTVTPSSPKLPASAAELSSNTSSPLRALGVVGGHPPPGASTSSAAQPADSGGGSELQPEGGRGESPAVAASNRQYARWLLRRGWTAWTVEMQLQSTARDRLVALARLKWLQRVLRAWRRDTLEAATARQAEAYLQRQARELGRLEVAEQFHKLYQMQRALRGWVRYCQEAAAVRAQEQELQLLAAQEEQRKLVVADRFHALYAAYHCFSSWRQLAQQMRQLRTLHARPPAAAAAGCSDDSKEAKIQGLLQRLAAQSQTAAQPPPATGVAVGGAAAVATRSGRDGRTAPSAVADATHMVAGGSRRQPKPQNQAASCSATRVRLGVEVAEGAAVSAPTAARGVASASADSSAVQTARVEGRCLAPQEAPAVAAWCTDEHQSHAAAAQPPRQQAEGVRGCSSAEQACEIAGNAAPAQLPNDAASAELAVSRCPTSSGGGIGCSYDRVAGAPVQLQQTLLPHSAAAAENVVGENDGTDSTTRRQTSEAAAPPDAQQEGGLNSDRDPGSCSSSSWKTRDRQSAAGMTSYDAAAAAPPSQQRQAHQGRSTSLPARTGHNRSGNDPDCGQPAVGGGGCTVARQQDGGTETITARSTAPGAACVALHGANPASPAAKLRESLSARTDHNCSGDDRNCGQPAASPAVKLRGSQPNAQRQPQQNHHHQRQHRAGSGEPEVDQPKPQRRLHQHVQQQRAGSGELEADQQLRAIRARELRQQHDADATLLAVEQQLAVQQHALAQLHYNRSLVLRCGLQPWRLLLQRSQQRFASAARHWQLRCYSLAFGSWRDLLYRRRYSNAVAHIQAHGKLQHVARSVALTTALCRLLTWSRSGRFARRQLLRRCMDCLLLSARQRSQMWQSAGQLYRGKLLLGCLLAWRMQAQQQADARVLRELQQQQVADACADRALLRKGFTAWRQAAADAVAEGQRQQKLAQTWGKINGWLQELQQDSAPLMEAGEQRLFQQPLQSDGAGDQNSSSARDGWQFAAAVDEIARASSDASGVKGCEPQQLLHEKLRAWRHFVATSTTLRLPI